MFCATCFKKAEEGSKFCATCRQTREAGGVAWNLPEAANAAPTWTPNTETVASPADTPWSEGTAWSPPPKIGQGATAAPGPAGLASPPAAPLPEPEPPRVPSRQPAAVAVAEDDFISNPFGEPVDPIPSAPVPASVPAAPLPVARVSPPVAPPAPRPAEAPTAAQPVATFVATAPGAEISAEQISRQELFQARPKTQSYMVPDHELATITELHKTPRAGGNPLVAVLSAGIVVLSLIGVGKMVTNSSKSPQAESTATVAESADTAQRFLTSAKASLQAKDYELAASQLKKAVDELENSGAAESELSAARMLLAQALFHQGKGREAHDVLAQMAGGSLKADAGKLSKEVDKALRKQAESLIAQGDASLQAGNLNEALEISRDAERMMTRYGGSPDQVKRAKALLARAEKADGARGLARTSSQSVSYQQDVQQPTYNVRVQQQAYPRHRRPAPPNRETAVIVAPDQGFPQARPRPQQEEVSPDSLPMANAMRGRRPGGRPVPQRPQGQIPQEMPPESQGGPEVNSGPAQQPTTGYSSSNSSSRPSRRGSDGVLPGYDSQDNGGSAY